MKELVDLLINKNLTIASMESCTGGGFANEITNIPGSSDILKYSCVTYSNEFKIKMGVSEELIEKYSVYSIEVARDMALNISKFAGSKVGVGITGKLNVPDLNNPRGKQNEVYVSILYKDTYYDLDILVHNKTRKENKEEIINQIIDKLKVILNN